MTLRSSGFRSQTAGKEVLDYDIMREQAAALGRLGRALEVALTALSDHDHAQAERAGNDAAVAAPVTAIRKRLVHEAGHALWCFVVQREACGLRDQRLIMRNYRVPREVQHCMGAFGAGCRRHRAEDS
jgi:hypothetical protein